MSVSKPFETIITIKISGVSRRNENDSYSFQEKLLIDFINGTLEAYKNLFKRTKIKKVIKKIK